MSDAQPPASTHVQRLEAIIAQQQATIEKQQITIAQLEALVVEQQQPIVQLRLENADLKVRIAKLERNSSNSSKPPSGDIVTPPRDAKRKGSGRIGGQPGHPRYQRKAFTADQIDRVKKHTRSRCPACGGALQPSPQPPKVVQQIELPEQPALITEHRAQAYWCTGCQQVHYAPMPATVAAAGLIGPRLSAYIAYLKGAGHMSYRGIQKLLRDAWRIDLSTGEITARVMQMSAALEAPYEQLRAELPAQPALNIDETGHKEKGDRLYTWCFRAELFTLFHIDPTRSSEVLIEHLGREFNGVIGCDYFSAYRKYMADFGVTVQFCLAHLIRDVKALVDFPDPVTANYGRRVLSQLRKLFRVIHRREQMPVEKFQAALTRARERIVAIAKRAPPRSEAQNMAERFRQHGAAYFTFITTPGIEPTNNLAEQAIRFVVIDRRVTQGTRGATGRRWCERIWTVAATCSQQTRSVFQFLHTALEAHLQSAPAPSLLPAYAHFP